MGKGPELFTDIGKTAKDLLIKDYVQDQKFTITTQTDSGLAFTSSAIKKGDFFLGDVNTQFKNKNLTTDVKVDTNSNIFVTLTMDEIAQGLKAKFSFTVPDQRSGKVEFQYLHEHAGISCSVGLTSAPIAELSGAFGGEGFAVGGEVAFDTASEAFLKYNAGVGFTMPDFCAAVILVDKGELLKASYSHVTNPISNTTIAAEIVHKFSTNENTLTVGNSLALDPLTTVKTRLNNHGKLGVLIQHEWRPKSLITISSEVDTKALDKRAKVGLALALKP